MTPITDIIRYIEKKKNMQYRKLTDLKKLDKNPRTIKVSDMERLVNSIKDNPEYFEARPLILSNRTGELVIIAGNQRYEAARMLGLHEVPTHLIEGLSEEKEREIVIRDNVTAGEFDWDILANEWAESELTDWGVDIPVPKEMDTSQEKPSNMLSCPECGHENDKSAFKPVEEF